MGFSLFLTFCYIWLCSASSTSTAATVSDTLKPNQVLKDGQTLVSSGQRFELGFFSPGSSSNRYLGIMYKNLPLTVVWIANRNNSIIGLSGSISVGSNGFSLLANDSVTIWSVNATVVLKSPILQILDNGNLVLREENNGDSEGYMWQSFDDITDTMLPEMKLGWNLKNGLHRYMTSWLSANDPSVGEFSFSLDPPETPQLVLRKGTLKRNRWGPWDGVRFSGSNALRSNPVFIPMFNSSIEEVYYTFIVEDQSLLSRFVVTQDGLIQYLTWSKNSNEWAVMVTLQRDSCDSYGVCGPYGNCYDGPKCECLKGFTPKSPVDWARVDWSGGCVRNWKLDCGNGDGFVKYGGMKLPDYSHLAESRNLSFEECEAVCLRNCTCMAFTKIDIHGNGGDCVLWFDDLLDMRDFEGGGDDLYVRMAKAELEAIADAKRDRRVKVIVTSVICSVTGILLLGVIGWFAFRMRRAKRRAESLRNSHRESVEETQEEDLELPLIDLEIVSAATDKFSFRNKIGQGGFGPVYKGVLPTGQEIAVKRLSQNSGQGLREFKNEVILIANLQHRNLVKLLGCCIRREERMLIYEYLPNRSLDNFLFARGLLYLHQDSRLRIIHRDLKASNILLDSEMNPKISDFGIARIFGGEQTEEMTKRVIGTYGYMSPEYAMSGHFSVKSDVFSFGVLLLEIISGKKNWGFYHPDHDLNLLGHAWKLWNEGNPLELMDALMEESYSGNEVIRCIQVGLLCVQQRAEDRPTMSTVLLMLSTENTMVPQPKEPGFCTEVSSMGKDTSSSGKNPHTANEVTVTVLEAR
uniref:Receptor-like serine/threonine-protein kinase n=1 Tax=Fagus sylvatica TaxID=28930 RepID=A0A2N9ER32_FAGSY